jgi:hypothetical protein
MAAVTVYRFLDALIPGDLTVPFEYLLEQEAKDSHN